MSHRWRVAVLGLGHWYSAYGLGRSLREFGGAELVGAAEADRQQLETFGRTFGVPVYDTATELFAREDVDIVHIAAPVSRLAELTILAAEAGKHMIMGKPMAMSVAEADRMVEVVERSGVKAFPFQGIMRLRSGDLKARLDAGLVGDLAVLHQTSRWSIAEDAPSSGRPGWFADSRYVPGGALIDEGIYWIDLFRWLANSEVVSVEAKIANLVHKDIDVEDWGMATFTFASGLIATLEASWTINAPRKTGPSPKQNSVVRLEVVGTRGEVIDQWFRAPGLAVLAAGAPDWVYERQSEPPFAQPAPFPLTHLLDCLDNDKPPAASIRDARQAFAAAMAAYESARLARPVAPA